MFFMYLIKWKLGLNRGKNVHKNEQGLKYMIVCVRMCVCVCVCVGVGAWACVRKFNSWKLQFISTTANVTGTMSNQIKSTEYRKIQKRMVLYMYISTIFSNSKEAIASWQVDIVL